MSLEELFKKADSLTAKGESEGYTAEIIAELKSVSDEIDAEKNRIELKRQADDLRNQMNVSAAIVKQHQNTVPPENRPVTAATVTKARTTGTGSGSVVKTFGIANRDMRPDLDLSLPENDYIVDVCKSEGFSDSTLEMANTLAYKRAVVAYMKSGGKIVPDMIKTAMQEAVGQDGNVLVPVQWQQLIMNRPYMNMIEGAVRTIPVTGFEHTFPRIKTTDNRYPAAPVVVTWGGENPQSPPDQGQNFKTDPAKIFVHECTAYGSFTISLLEDNAYGLNVLVPEIFRQTLAVDIDKVIVTGDGQNKPYGLDEKGTGAGTPPIIDAVETAGATLTYSDLTKIKYSVPQQYRGQAAWLMNSKTLGLVADMKDKNDRPLWEPRYGFIGDEPGGGTSWDNGALLGRPILVSEFMPDVGAGNTPIYFADFNYLYYWLVRVSPTFRVLDQPRYINNEYLIAMRSRYGGRVVWPDAGRGLKIKAGP